MSGIFNAKEADITLTQTTDFARGDTIGAKCGATVLENRGQVLHIQAFPEPEVCGDCGWLEKCSVAIKGTDIDL